MPYRLKKTFYRSKKAVFFLLAKILIWQVFVDPSHLFPSIFPQQKTITVKNKKATDKY
jgi:hypothetical protein